MVSNDRREACIFICLQTCARSHDSTALQRYSYMSLSDDDETFNNRARRFDDRSAMRAHRAFDSADVDMLDISRSDGDMNERRLQNSTRFVLHVQYPPSNIGFREPTSLSATWHVNPRRRAACRLYNLPVWLDERDYAVGVSCEQAASARARKQNMRTCAHFVDKICL